MSEAQNIFWLQAQCLPGKRNWGMMPAKRLAVRWGGSEVAEDLKSPEVFC